MTNRLYRSNNERMLLGVCGGIAERYDLDPTFVRLAFILAFVLGFSGGLAYCVAALLIPRAPELGAGIRARQLAPIPRGR